MEQDFENRPSDVSYPEATMTDAEISDAYGLAQMAELDYAETEAAILAAERAAGVQTCSETSKSP